MHEVHVVLHRDNELVMAHWKLIAKRILRRVKYVFDLRELLNWKYESCENCGHCFKVCWTAEDKNWVEVYGNDGGCLCIDCFVERARRKGVKPKIESMQVFNPEE